MTGWQFDVVEQHDRVLRTAVRQAGEAISWQAVIDRWRDDPGFRRHFSQALAEVPFAAFFWETPPLTAETARRPFEYVCVEAPELAGVAPDGEAFAEHFDARCDAHGIVAFENLSGDACLIVPCPLAALEHYVHLAGFVRQAPAPQQEAFWQRLGQAVAARISDRPLWVSTSGAGVHWLHARLDSRPKYYTYAAYRHVE